MKRDLAEAFRHIPVAESDWWLLGFSWDGNYYMERYLPLGLRTAPFVFDLFAKGLNWILVDAGWQIIHYLDNFLAVLEGAEADKYELFFRYVCTQLGLTINEKKSARGTLAEFLGIELDTEQMEARLPSDNLLKAREWVAQVLDKQTITRQDLKSLLGFLSFACKVVVPGRAFLRRLFTALAQKKQYYAIDRDMRADLQYWHEFLPKWNGIRLLELHSSRPKIQMWTDASGNWGMDGYFLEDGQSITSVPQAFSQRFSTRERPEHINTKEMFAVLFAVRKWLHHLVGSRLIIYGDNFAVIQGIIYSSIRGLAMIPLRKMVMLFALNNIMTEAIWIPSKVNFLADVLSRGNAKKLADKHSHISQVFPQPASQ